MRLITLIIGNLKKPGRTSGVNVETEMTTLGVTVDGVPLMPVNPGRGIITEIIRLGNCRVGNKGFLEKRCETLC